MAKLKICLKIITIFGVILSMFLPGCSDKAVGNETTNDIDETVAFNVILADGDGLKDGKIKVKTVEGGNGGGLYCDISLSPDKPEIPEISPLLLNEEIGENLTQEHWLRVYEMDNGNNIINYWSTKLTYKDIGNVILGPLDTINAKSGDYKWYGESTWTDYIIEADVKNLTDTGGSPWPNMQFRFRYGKDYYYYIFINDNWSMNLQDNIDWGMRSQGYPGAIPTDQSVHYKIIVDGDTITGYADDKEAFDYTETRVDAHALISGKVGWAAEGASCTIENFTVKRIRKENKNENESKGEAMKRTISSASVSEIKAPVAGIYPNDMFKYGRGAAYNETLDWNPAVAKTFESDTVYTATVTLIPNYTTSTFEGIDKAEVKGLPTEKVTSTDIKVVDDNLVITVVFEKTGGESAVFNENEGLLFYDDFDGDKLDMTKWAYPSDQLRHGRSAWDKNMVSVRDGNLIIGIKRDPEAGEKYNIKNDKNFIRTGAVETAGIFANVYGYYEANIKFPVVRGTWGAFWMYGDSVGGTDYEGVDGTEIDIVESIGNDKGESSSNLHWNGYGSAHKAVGSGNYTKKDYASPTGIYDGEFHTFAIDWSPAEYIFYIDGKEMWRVDGGKKFDNVGICRNPLHVILSVEGAEWAGTLPGKFEYDEMVVDYVRVYDRPRFGD